MRSRISVISQSSSSDPGLRVLAVRLRNADGTALEPFIEGTQAEAFRLCSGMSDPHGAQARLEEAYSVVCRDIHALRDPGAILEWFLGIVAERCGSPAENDRPSESGLPPDFARSLACRLKGLLKPPPWYRFIDRPRRPPGKPLEVLRDVMRYGTAMAAGCGLWAVQFTLAHYAVYRPWGEAGSVLSGIGSEWGLPAPQFFAMLAGLSAILLAAAMSAANLPACVRAWRSQKHVGAGWVLSSAMGFVCLSLALGVMVELSVLDGDSGWSPDAATPLDFLVGRSVMLALACGTVAVAEILLLSRCGLPRVSRGLAAAGGIAVIVGVCALFLAWPNMKTGDWAYKGPYPVEARDYCHAATFILGFALLGWFVGGWLSLGASSAHRPFRLGMGLFLIGVAVEACCFIALPSFGWLAAAPTNTRSPVSESESDGSYCCEVVTLSPVPDGCPLLTQDGCLLDSVHHSTMKTSPAGTNFDRLQSLAWARVQGNPDLWLKVAHMKFKRDATDFSRCREWNEDTVRWILSQDRNLPPEVARTLQEVETSHNRIEGRLWLDGIPAVGVQVRITSYAEDISLRATWRSQSSRPWFLPDDGIELESEFVQQDLRATQPFLMRDRPARHVDFGRCEKILETPFNACETDVQGRFHFDHLARGQYLIHVLHSCPKFAYRGLASYSDLRNMPGIITISDLSSTIDVGELHLLSGRYHDLWEHQYSKGLESLEHKSPKVAAESLIQALQVEPDNARSHLALALAYHEMQRTRASQAECERAIDLGHDTEVESRARLFLDGIGLPAPLPSSQYPLVLTTESQQDSPFRLPVTLTRRGFDAISRDPLPAPFKARVMNDTQASMCYRKAADFLRMKFGMVLDRPLKVLDDGNNCYDSNGEVGVRLGQAEDTFTATAAGQMATVWLWDRTGWPNWSLSDSDRWCLVHWGFGAWIQFKTAVANHDVRVAQLLLANPTNEGLRYVRAIEEKSGERGVFEYVLDPKNTR